MTGPLEVRISEPKLRKGNERTPFMLLCFSCERTPTTTTRYICGKGGKLNAARRNERLVDVCFIRERSQQRGNNNNNNNYMSDENTTQIVWKCGELDKA